MDKVTIQKIMDDIRLDTNDLDAVWRRQPELVAIYGFKQVEAERVASSAKRDLESVEARLYSTTRAGMSFDGVRISESTIEAKLKSAPAYLAARQKYDDAKYLAEFYKQVSNALGHRRDMIVQASKKAISEYERTGTERFNSPKNVT
ncbi:hypothetical protein ACLH2J_25040 [Klebsiella michiganensis]|uniref:hypothetical protein n=1 Tax=Klebsiella michiganensis TaxID=1134687 RepID=UPI000FEC00D4|nr:hypothetical protein [Klebsiella michiganensis]RWS81033.1 hypothetical protein DN614_24425 [Klebsiella michiganensis]